MSPRKKTDSFFLRKPDPSRAQRIVEYGDRLAVSTTSIVCAECGEAKTINALDRLRGRSLCYECHPPYPIEKGGSR